MAEQPLPDNVIRFPGPGRTTDPSRGAVDAVPPTFRGVWSAIRADDLPAAAAAVQGLLELDGARAREAALHYHQWHARDASAALLALMRVRQEVTVGPLRDSIALLDRCFGLSEDAALRTLTALRRRAPDV